MKRLPNKSGMPRLTGERARDLWRLGFSEWRRSGRGGADPVTFARACRLLRILGCQWGLPRVASLWEQSTPLRRERDVIGFRFHGPTRTGRAFLRRT